MSEEQKQPIEHNMRIMLGYHPTYCYTESSALNCFC